MTMTRSQNLRDEVQVVADEDQAHAAAGDEFIEDGEHLGADGDVEGGGGLVGDEEIGFAHHHHGDHDALAHAARELVGVEGEDAFGLADVDGLEGAEGLLLCIMAGDVVVADADGFDDLATDGHDRVQREFWILQDHAHATAAQRASQLW